MKAVRGAPPMKKYVKDHVKFICIGAGLPRTGTMSTFVALEQLLPGKCHHMVRAIVDGKSNTSFWAKAETGKLTDSDFKEFVKSERLSAAVDYPMSLYWKDLSRLYPNAKVLLTVRDPVKWYNSVNNTVRQIERFTKSRTALPLRVISWFSGRSFQPATFTCNAGTYLGARYPRGLFGAIDAGQETSIEFFNAWRDEVIKEIPSDRLLIFEVKQGWEPLCKFLGVPQPDGPFPRINDTEKQHENLKKMKAFCYIIWSMVVAGVGVTSYQLKDRVPKIVVTL